MRDPQMPSDAELMRELERAELRRLEASGQTIRVRRAPTTRPPR